MATHEGSERDEAVIRYWRTIRTHTYVVIACFSVGVLAAAVTSYLMTPIYRATALVLVENEMPVIVGMQGMYPSEGPEDSYCRTQTRLIRSRSVLRAAAERLQLGRWEEFAGEDDVVAALAERVKVSQMSGTKLIQVSFDGPDRGKVDDVANAIVKCFQEESTRRRKQSSEDATGWLEEQLPRLRAELLEAERRLQKFQEENNVVSSDRSQDIISQRLAQLNRDFTGAESERIALDAEFSLAEAAGNDPAKLASLPRLLENPTLRGIEARTVELQNRRTDFLKNLTPDHPDVRSTEAKIAAFEAKRRETIQSVLSAVQNQRAAARAREKALHAALAEEQRKALAFNGKLIRLHALQRQVEHAKQLYEPLIERSGKLGLASGLNPVPVQIVDLAEEPLRPIKPRKALFLAAGALLGLLVGVRLAFFLERSDTRVRGPEDLQGAGGLTALGVIPHMEAKKDGNLSTVCHSDPRSVAAEAYRSLRTSLLLSTSASDPMVLLVTSALDSEGKTTMATNIASAMAQGEKRVLVVDADLRRSSVHRAFGIENGAGLHTYLSDGLGPAEAIRESGLSGLSVVPAGGASENPSELLGSPRMVEFLNWARMNYDVVIVDSPPLASVTDARVLAPHVDGVVLVVRADRTPRDLVAHGLELLDSAKANVLGAVLNDMQRSRHRYGYGYYRYGYRDYYAEAKD